MKPFFHGKKYLSRGGAFYVGSRYCVEILYQDNCNIIIHIVGKETMMFEGGIIGLFDDIKCGIRCSKAILDEKIAHVKVEMTSSLLNAEDECDEERGGKE